MPDVANDCKKSEVSINTQFKKKERKSEKDFMAVIMVQAWKGSLTTMNYKSHDALDLAHLKYADSVNFVSNYSLQ